MGKFIDRVLDAFSSEERRAREQAFKALRSNPAYQKKLDAIAGGYYRGERRGRTLGEWRTSEADANELLTHSLSDLRNDSNDLYVNNAIGSGIVKTYVTNVVGTGLQLSPSIDYEYLGLSLDQADELQAQIEREWQLFIRDCDVTRQSKWGELQQIVLRSCLLSGDIFVNLPFRKRAGVTYETCLNLIEGQRVCNPGMAGDTESMIMGVEIDRDGSPFRYHYAKGLGLGKKKEWRILRVFDSVGNRMVLHVFRKERANQLRGAPILAPIIELVKKLDTYSQAEVDAAVINAFFTVFIKKRAPQPGGNILDGVSNMADETGATASDKDLKLGSATIVELFEDEEGIDLADPQRPNANFTAFFEAIVSEIAVGVGLPREVVMKAFNASYSASRGAILEAVKVFKEWEQFMVDEFCQPVYEAFLWEAVSTGRINAPDFLVDPLVRMAYCAADWIGVEQAELDPMKAANAAEKRMNIGVSNQIIETQARGRDFRKVVRGAKRAQRLSGQNAQTSAPADNSIPQS